MIKKMVSMMFVLGLVCLAFAGGAAAAQPEIWDGTVAESFAGGSGTPEDPYLICNGAQLALIEQYSYGGFHFKIVADIYLNDTADWKSWTAEHGPANEWTPISYFSGVLDGDGHTIRGMYVSAKTADHSGLIKSAIGEQTSLRNISVEESAVFSIDCGGMLVGYVTNAVIENCHNGGNVTATGEWGIGGIVGSCFQGTVINCSNSGLISGTNQGVGGIVGCLSSGTMERCTNNGTVVGGDRFVGGIVGMTGGESVVSGCVNNGAVLGEDCVGGVCGMLGTGDWENAMVGPKVTDCINSGRVEARKEIAGGIVGSLNSEAEPGIVEQCVNAGAVVVPATNGSWCGGIVGVAGARRGLQAVIRNCHNAGTMTGNTSVGGVVGHLWIEPGEIGKVLLETSYNIGTAVGESKAGGIVGSIYAGTTGGTVEVRNCYTLSAAATEAVDKWGGPGTEIVTNVKALTDAQMRQADSFVGFDFDTVWYSAGDGSYPTLLVTKGTGTLGEAAEFTVYQSGRAVVSAASGMAKSVSVLMVSYENGRMADCAMVQLRPGQTEELLLKELGDEIKLFALSGEYLPLCAAKKI